MRRLEDRKRAAAGLAVACAAIAVPLPALAWKPKTHIYLAEQALAEIYSNRIRFNVLDAEGQPILELGPYRIDVELAAAITSTSRKQYLAGVLGPDAYPDMLTGQMNIHPTVAAAVSGSEKGTDAFLRHLWNAAQNTSKEAARLRRSAFVLGYLTHAAGDMFAHTLMNHYAGGPFQLGDNAARHIVMEGYVGEKTPSASRDFSIEDLGGFIHKNLVRADSDTELHKKLFVDPDDPVERAKLDVLVPRYYSQLRNVLTHDIDAFNDLPDHDPARLALRPLHDYKVWWRKAIDTGLEQWVLLNHDLARRIIHPPASGTDFKGADALIEDYRLESWLMMDGVPRELAWAANQVNEWKEQIVKKTGLERLEDDMNSMMEDGISFMVTALTGIPYSKWKAYVDSPAEHFNDVIDKAGPPANPAWAPRRIRRGDFDEKELKLEPGMLMDWRQVPAAYNTVQMTKLLFLDKTEVNRFLGDLAAALDRPTQSDRAPIPPKTPKAVTPSPFVVRAPRLELKQPNIMLGFLQSIDAGNQWNMRYSESSKKESCKQSKRMVLAQHHGSFRAVFKKQSGEGPVGCFAIDPT